MTTTTRGTAALRTPTSGLLTASLIVAPLAYLAADSLYAALGWGDPVAGTVHILAAIAYGLVVLRVTAWLPATSRLAAVLIVVGLIGMAGNVAYGFDTIHVSLGDTALVDQSGAATIIKPLGLFFPLSLALIAVAMWLLRHRWQAVVVLVAALAWPIGHIANIPPLAVATNVALVVAFGTLVWKRSIPDAATDDPAAG